MNKPDHEPDPRPPRRRDPAGHKGTFGTVCVVGGQAAGPRVMIGGPAFSATAALRSGAGLAMLAVPAPLMAAALTIAPEATGLALPVDGHLALKPSDVAQVLDDAIARIDCLAVGPGWGAELPQQQILVRLISAGDRPMVIDADALNALAALPDIQADFKVPAVLTPHPGEYRRLAARFGIEADPVSPDTRPDAACALARHLGCVVVLKGAGTVISNGIDTVVNDTGNVALATAGTGDVLTGIIAGIIAQHFDGPAGPIASADDGLSLLECAMLGVRGHGLAGDLWAAEHGDAGLLARDLLDLVPVALARVGGHGA